MTLTKPSAKPRKPRVSRSRRRSSSSSADAVARHLHEPQLRNLEHRGARLVALQPLPKDVADAFTIYVFGHVDEIDDDDAADVAQAQLIDDLFGCLQVGLQDRVLLAAFA